MSHWRSSRLGGSGQSQRLSIPWVSLRECISNMHIMVRHELFRSTKAISQWQKVILYLRWPWLETDLLYGESDKNSGKFPHLLTTLFGFFDYINNILITLGIISKHGEFIISILTLPGNKIKTSSPAENEQRILILECKQTNKCQHGFMSVLFISVYSGCTVQ